MPPVSEAQRRWAFANKDKNKAAAEFAAADTGGKLPARAKPKTPAKMHRADSRRDLVKMWKGK
jgi:hypothetical protein